MPDDSTSSRIAAIVILQIRRTLVCLMISWQMHMRLGRHLQQIVPERVACDVCHSIYSAADLKWAE